MLPTRSTMSVFLAIAALDLGCPNRPREEAVPQPQSTVTFDSEYQAVVLTDGHAFFGKLEGLGTPYPVLRDVYYVRPTPDPQGGPETANLLVKRGQESHAPEYMVLNANHILLVEPVARDSKVAELIAQQKSN